MDMGAEGLMLPMVGSVAETSHILKCMKYTPEGGRGVALQVSHDRCRPSAVAEKFAAANRRSTLFCQIETVEGVRNADTITALPGVDCSGLDVPAQEPPDPDDPILKLDNVILAPHALCWTDQLFAANGAADVKTVLDVQHGRTPYIVVNRAVLGTERWQRRMADFRARFGR